MVPTYLELSEGGGGSHKFYQVATKGRQVITRYGRIGTDGQTKTKEFDDDDKAQKSYDKLVEQKTKKGYVESEEG